MRPVVADMRHNVLGTGGGFGLQLGQDLFFEVVVLEIGVWQGLHCTGQFEQALFFTSQSIVAEFALVGSLQQRNEILPFVEVANGPGTMIQTNKGCIKLIGIEIGQRGVMVSIRDGSFTERESRDRGMMSHRLRDEIDGIGVIEETSVGTDRLHIGNDVLHDSNGAQSHKEAARSLSFLTDHTMFEGNAFIQIAGLEATWTIAGQDSVTVLQSLTPIGSNGKGQIQPAHTRHFLRKRLDDLQALFVQIDQYNFRAIKVCPLMNERSHSASATCTAATDISELNTSHDILSYAAPR